MHVIKQIIRLQEGKHDAVYRVWCPFCEMDYALLLNGVTGKYECMYCHKQGRTDDLLVYFEDGFERKHREIIGTMSERDAVDL